MQKSMKLPLSDHRKFIWMLKKLTATEKATTGTAIAYN